MSITTPSNPVTSTSMSYVSMSHTLTPWLLSSEPYRRLGLRCTKVYSLPTLTTHLSTSLGTDGEVRVVSWKRRVTCTHERQGVRRTGRGGIKECNECNEC